MRTQPNQPVALSLLHRRKALFTFQTTCQSFMCMLPPPSFLTRSGWFLISRMWDRIASTTCPAGRNQSDQESDVRLVLDDGALTVVLEKEAFDSIMTLLDHVELERGAQEPVPHLGATERGAREICDTCGRRWAQSRSSSTSVRTELAGSPNNESPSLVARECVAAWASSRKTCKDLRAGRCQVSLDPDERSRSYS